MITKTLKFVLFAIILCVICSSCTQKNDITEPIVGIGENIQLKYNDNVIDDSLVSIPMSDLGFDTHYSPLSDINSNKIIEIQVNENQIENNGVIFEKTKGYKVVTNKQGFSVLLIDEKGNYITVGEVEQNGGYSDICIVKYDKNGKETKTRVTHL